MRNGARHVTAASERTTPPAGATTPHATSPRAESPHHPDFPGCYGCAPCEDSGLGIRLVGAAAPSSVTEFTVRGHHQGAAGVAHGGVVAAALDEAMGIAVWSLGRACATARLEIDYLAPVPVGSVLHLRTRCTARHGRKVYVEAEAFLDGPEGPLAARAAALYVERADTDRTEPR